MHLGSRLPLGTFEGVLGWEAAIDFKTALVISQLVGYAASKWIGIKVVSEMTACTEGCGDFTVDRDRGNRTCPVCYVAKRRLTLSLCFSMG